MMNKVFGRQVFKDSPQVASGYLRVQRWTNPAAAAAAAILNDAADNQTHTVFVGQPDFARKLQIVASGAATEVVVVNGTNIRGETISESFTLNATTPVLGTKAFKTVTSVVFPDTAGGRTIDLGYTDALGLDRCMREASVLDAYADGVRETTAATITFDSDEVEKNTVDLNTALNGAVDVAVAFITTDLTTKSGTSA